MTLVCSRNSKEVIRNHEFVVDSFVIDRFVIDRFVMDSFVMDGFVMDSFVLDRFVIERFVIIVILNLSCDCEFVARVIP
jgi:hypothetical protein